MDASNIMRDIDRPLPGDVSESKRRNSKVNPDLAKRKSAYYMAEFASSRDDPPPKPSNRASVIPSAAANMNTPSSRDREKARNESFVMAELRTNVIIDDEFRFITDLSYHLSNRYQRPMSSIIVNLQHGCCMMFGGSFDPAYTLAIHGIPSVVASTVNKRNAALIQSHIEETLRVKAGRGYLRFIATPEDTVANGGKTLAGEMGLDGPEDLNKEDKRMSRAMKVRSIRNSFMPSSKPPPMPSSIELARLPTPPESTDDNNNNIGTIHEHPPSPEESHHNPFSSPEDNDMKKKRTSVMGGLFNKNQGKQRPSTSSGAM